MDVFDSKALDDYLKKVANATSKMPCCPKTGDDYERRIALYLAEKGYIKFTGSYLFSYLTDLGEEILRKGGFVGIAIAEKNEASREKRNLRLWDIGKDAIKIVIGLILGYLFRIITES